MSSDDREFSYFPHDNPMKRAVYNAMQEHGFTPITVGGPYKTGIADDATIYLEGYAQLANGITNPITNPIPSSDELTALSFEAVNKWIQEQTKKDNDDETN